MSESRPTTDIDVALIGGGIMSATLGTVFKKVQPDWSVELYERMDELAEESSNPWNNAGTGHSALCELNYTPAQSDGAINPAKAININEQFQLSRQFWSHLVTAGDISSPENFINTVPHMSFVIGERNQKFLKTRFETLRKQPLFSTMQYSEDPEQIAQWAPLVMRGRDRSETIAATRVDEGTDVDFGRLTKDLVGYVSAKGGEIRMNTEVTDLQRATDGKWELTIKNRTTGEKYKQRARFVFIGSGGDALHLLQKSGIPQAKGYGGFPVSGKFFRCTAEDVVSQHNAKVYGQASVGAPPMSVPHLDTRYVGGKRSLMFGPYGGFSTNFLKHSSLLDLPLSVRPGNIVPMLAVAVQNLGLLKYLISEITKSRAARVDALHEYYPEADGGKWELITAGQRVQVMKKVPKKVGELQFGTEVITSSDGTVSALLGASPGASTAVPIMIELLQRCFPQHYSKRWEDALREMIPTLGQKLNDNADLASRTMSETAQALHLKG